jgi:hypothetical protein
VPAPVEVASRPVQIHGVRYLQLRSDPGDGGQ